MKILNRLRFPVFFWFALTMLTFSVLAADMTMPCSRCGTSIPFEPNTDYCHGYRVVCPNCGESYAPRHSWLEASRIPATCTAAGTVNYTCSVCNETKSEFFRPIATGGKRWKVIPHSPCAATVSIPPCGRRWRWSGTSKGKK